MSFEDLLTQTIIVERWSQVTYSEDANEDTVASTPDELTYSGLIQGRDPSLADRTREIRTGPATLISDYLLFLPADATIDAKDRVRSDDDTYEVIGDPIVFNSPRGPHHIEAALRRITT